MTLENGYLLRKRYRIIDILGQGGMGAVYRAVDENLDITVAIKENAIYTDDDARQFQREAKVLAALRHPNLPRVFDYFVIEGQAQYLIMDYIDGEDLRQWMAREEDIREIEALQIGIAICDALIYLHSRVPAIAHRDIKPGNIKITPDGEIVLVDFGLVKLLRDQEDTTTAARGLSPGYSPPEQYGEASTDHRSDIYSLGATLYAALAGYLPEDGLARMMGKDQLTPLRSYQPCLSRPTVRAIETALNLRFEDRWQSAGAFKNALVSARDALPSDEREKSRLAVVEQAETHDDEGTANISGKNGSQLRRQLPGAQWLKALDPIWYLFGAVIFLLALALGVFLIRPFGLGRIMSGSVATIATDTQPAIRNPTEAAYLPAASPTDAPEPTHTPSLANPETVIFANTPSPTPVGGGAGKLAYVSERSGIPQIWLVDVTSLETNQLTDIPDGACQPDWSPDGKQMVFTSPCIGRRNRYPGSGLVVMDVEAGTLTSLPTSLEGDFDPAWSPDGNWIAYTTLINGKSQLFKIAMRDLSIERLSDGAYHDSSPAWSPDGSRLAFVRIHSYAQIWLMDADGGNAVQFSLSGTINNSNPAWFPDENLILFSQALGLGSPSKQLYGMRLDDIGKTEEYPVIPRNRLDYIPLMDNVDVSPDGYWLAFDYWYFDQLSDIYMMTFPGANLTQLTDYSGLDYDPVWSPLVD